MKFAYGLPIILLAATKVMVMHQVAVALKPTEVNAIAKKITVRISGPEAGSGVIVKKQGNTYTVLTNWHVVDTPGAYTIQTQNGKSYRINYKQVKRIPEIDLAILQFQSNQNYESANIANSDQVTEGTSVYAAGWITPDGGCLEQRCYNFSPGNIIGIRNRAKNGYGWQYSNEIGKGMSGGPVLDNQGQLVGINGRGRQNPTTGRTQFFAIPINTYKKLASAITPPATITSTLSPKPPQTLKLNLTSGQKEQIRKISQKANADIQKVFTDKQKKAIYDAIKAGTPPQQAFANIKISDQQKLRLQKIIASFQKDRFNVLTDEQKQRVNEYRNKVRQQQLQQQQKK